MRKLTLLTLVLGFLALVGSPAAAQSETNRINWVDRASTDVRLPSGWRINACEGDAPVLCAADPRGVIDGTILLAVSDLTTESDLSRSAVASEVASFHRVFREDRLATCGSTYRFEGDPLVDVVVGGVPGFRFGFTIRDGGGNVTEKAVIHLAFAAGQQYVMNTSFTDPAGCPGEDPDRVEFPVAAMGEILPHLDRVAGDTILPTDFGAGPLCDAAVPPSGFTDTGGNPHQSLIDCLAAFDVVMGVTPTSFAPDRTVTRAQLASLVVRVLERFGEELARPTQPTFTDLGGSPHADAVERLAAAGVVRGTSTTTYSPNRAATRAEATAVVVRAYELMLRNEMYDAGVVFDDVSGTHATGISKAATSGLVHGTDSGGFEPGRSVRRDEMVAILGRTLNRMSWTRWLGRPA